MSDSIDYGNLMHDAMRGLIKTVLLQVQANGLPGDHHFFITFDTNHPDVEMADWLSDRYPDDMTVVMQHWFDNLDVADDGFAVTLNFGDAPEPLYIPFDAIQTFVDPSVEFGLRFESQDADESEDISLATDNPIDIVAGAATKADDSAKKPAKGADAEVVSLDSFRK